MTYISYRNYGEWTTTDATTSYPTPSGSITSYIERSLEEEEGEEMTQPKTTIHGMEVTPTECVEPLVRGLGLQLNKFFKRIIAHETENFHQQTCYFYCRVSRLPTRMKKMEGVDLHVNAHPQSIQYDANTLPHEADKLFYYKGKIIGSWFEVEKTLFLTDITHCDNMFAREVVQNILMLISGGTLQDLVDQIEGTDKLILQTKDALYQLQCIGKTPSDINIFKEELKAKAAQILQKAQQNYDKNVKQLQDTFDRKQKESVLMPEVSWDDIIKNDLRIYKEGKELVFMLPMSLNITKVASYKEVYTIPIKKQIHETCLLRIHVSNGRIFKYVVLNIDGTVAGVPHHLGSYDATKRDAHTCLGSADRQLYININSVEDIYNVRKIFERLMETINLESLGSPAVHFKELKDWCIGKVNDEKLEVADSVWMT